MGGEPFSIVAKASRLVLDLLFPQHCIGCGRTGELLCPACCHELPRLEGQLCARCGLPLSQAGFCSSCRAWPLALQGVSAPFRFEGRIRRAIHGLKYQNLRSLAVPLAELLAEHWRGLGWPGEVLVPVPLHPRRLRQRGFNQSALLARELGKRLALPVEEAALQRRQDTPAQARAASAEERRRNVEGAFFCRDRRLAGRSVVIVDDVCTTGATLDAAARALKASGASSVWGLTLAREV